jgi:hypothetical protein
MAERVTFSARSYQRAVERAWDAGARFLVTVWPRRSGKDKVWTFIALKALLRRPGLYLHIFPTLALARKALWDASSDGTKHRELFPEEIIVGGERDGVADHIRQRAIWQLLRAEESGLVAQAEPLRRGAVGCSRDERGGVAGALADPRREP